MNGAEQWGTEQQRAEDQAMQRKVGDWAMEEWELRTAGCDQTVNIKPQREHKSSAVLWLAFHRASFSKKHYTAPTCSIGFKHPPMCQNVTGLRYIPSYIQRDVYINLNKCLHICLNSNIYGTKYSKPYFWLLSIGANNSRLPCVTSRKRRPGGKRIRWHRNPDVHWVHTNQSVCQHSPDLIHLHQIMLRLAGQIPHCTQWQ